ncbi:MAG: FtsX-like permease family protein [Flavobacteriales bacterium]|nr:FtsX-like permease family protein [Flavobacteriales bacterium]
MNLPFHIARRYLFSKKSHNAINIISAISVVGVAVVTAAMVIVLSVFNGFEGLVVSLYNISEPPVRITPALGKTMVPDTLPMDRITAIEGVSETVHVLEESCLLRYRDKQYFARIKGVSDNYIEASGLGGHITDGTAQLRAGGASRLLMGAGVAYFLDAGINDPINPIEVYVPRRGVRGGMDPSKAFQVENLFPSGIFSVQQDFDVGYVIAPITLTRRLLEHGEVVSALEVYLDDDADMVTVRDRLTELLGDSFVVKDRYQQNELLYRIMKSEKWAVFLILAFILMVSIFNVTGSLTMLILDKRKDINILRSMGADDRLVRSIFLLEGLFITLSGATVGAVIGLLVCWAQITYGFVPLNASGNYIVQSYPVAVQAMDVVYVLLTVSAIGLLAAWLPVVKVIRPTKQLRMVQE